MKFTFTIQRKLVLFSLITLVSTSVVGGYCAATNLGSAKDQVMRNSSVIKLQLKDGEAGKLMHSATHNLDVIPKYV